MSTRNPTRKNTRREESGANKLDLRNEIQERHSARAEHWFEWVFDALRLPKHGEVLDMGSGTGSLWAENAKRIPTGCRVVMADTTPGMLREARNNGLPAHTRFLAASSQSIPFSDDQFDMVTAVGLLDLVPDVQQALSELGRVLRPGGTFAATAGGKGHLKELENLLLPYLPEEHARSIGGFEERFGLENGEDLLAPWFQNISRRDYHDRMIFREMQPILNYMLSEPAVNASLTLEQLGDLVGRIKRRLEKHGFFQVTIHKGLFTAKR